jgi:hypothetical protein
VLQVTDRLVSRSSTGKIEAFDSQSNKNLVFWTRNGLAAIAYTGLSFLGRGLHTDQWIADCLIGSATNEPTTGAPSWMMAGDWSATWPDMGQAIDRLQRKLAEAVANLQPREWRVHAPKLVVAGWIYYRRARARPFACEIFRHRTLGYTRRWLGRHLGRRALMGHCPIGQISRADFKALTASVNGKTLGQVEEAFVEQIRTTSKQQAVALQQVVGSDCMCITIQPPRGKLVVHAHYRPITPEQASFNHKGGEVQLPISYSPWILTPTFVQAPSIIGGGPGGTLTVGPLEVHFEGRGAAAGRPPAPSTGLIHIEQAQARRPRAY